LLSQRKSFEACFKSKRPRVVIDPACGINPGSYCSVKE
jgi:hypothetical protein